MFGIRLFVWLAIGVGASGYAAYQAQTPQAVEEVRDTHLKQFQNDDEVPVAIRRDKWDREYMYAGAAGGWMFLGCLLFAPEIARAIRRGNGVYRVAP